MNQIKILIIEDDESIIPFLEEVVKQKNLLPITATEPKTGIELFEKEVPEIAIVDLRFPGDIEGLDIIRKIKQIAPLTEIIIITGYGDFDIAILCLREGICDYIPKPIDVNILNSAIDRCLHRIEKWKRLRVKPNLLLLEDDKYTLERLKRILTEEGWNVFTGSDGEEGLKIFKQEKIDIALIDYRMPKLNGIEVLKEIKKITDDCEVIVFSGYGDENIVIELIREGATDFLKKPIDIDQLLTSLNKAWQKLTLRRSLVIPRQCQK